MIWVLLAIALFGGGGASGLEKQLKLDHKHAAAVLKGTEVRDPALKLLKSMKKISARSFDASQKQLNQSVKAGRDHSRPSTEIGSLLASRDHEISELDREFLDRRDELRALLTRDQWDAIFQADSIHASK